MKRSTKTLTQLKKQFDLSETELRAIRWAADGVWNDCAGDVLEAIAMEKNGYGRRGKHTAENVSLPKSHVIEIVLDANRFEESLKRMKEFKESPKLQAMFKKSYDAEVYDFLESYLKKEVFTYATYGM
jgi:hypothetical protein